MILLIGNKGSFSLECYDFLLNSNHNDIKLIYAGDLDASNISYITEGLNEYLEKGINHKVIYIGGEIKDAKSMHLHNFSIPVLLAEYCGQQNYQFILLGSLSQWGLIKWQCRTTIESSTPISAPYDEYSRTKQLCFKTINSSSAYNGYFICPASILNHKHQSGSLYTLRKIICLRWVNLIFQFRGMISYCEREDVFSSINLALLSGELANNVIVSKSISANEVAKIKQNKIKARLTYALGFMAYHFFFIIGLKNYSQKIALLFTEVNFISNQTKS
jgi:hypothetical protein